VNGFVNETRQNCPDGLERGVTARTPNQRWPAFMRRGHRRDAVTGSLITRGPPPLFRGNPPNPLWPSSSQGLLDDPAGLTVKPVVVYSPLITRNGSALPGPAWRHRRLISLWHNRRQVTPGTVETYGRLIRCSWVRAAADRFILWVARVRVHCRGHGWCSERGRR